MDNYITISRRIFEHPFWCEDRVYSRFEAWVDILQSARFEDTKQLIGNRLVEILRGQLPVSLRYLASRWKWSTKKVNSFLDCLILDNMILKETPKETGQTVLTICNYDKYNYIQENKKHRKKQEGNTEETPRKHQGNKCNIDNTDNKEYTSVYSLSSAKAKQLSPDTTVQCQCVSESTGIQCQRKALYSIDGKLYCNQHSKPFIGEILEVTDPQPVKSDFEKFNSWLETNAPNVLKLKSQITEPQFLKLKASYDTDQMTDIFCRMDNYKDLTKKYVSAYQTFLNWAKREYGNV